MPKTPVHWGLEQVTALEERIKQDDLFDPGFVQHRFACQGCAQAVTPHQKVEGTPWNVVCSQP